MEAWHAYENARVNAKCERFASDKTKYMHMYMYAHKV